jgi:DNA segregation ATPase FtsK/SpoIIIE, S-DNA-T family
VSKKRSNGGRVKKVIAVTLGVLGFLSLLGELGITSVGNEFYALLKYPLGSKAWIGPFILLIVAFIFWASSGTQERRRRTDVGKTRLKGSSKEKSNPKQQSGTRQRTDREIKVPLPKTKLVNLKGFNDYFSSPEGPEIGCLESLEELNDLGRDFTTYFKEGNEISFKPLGTRLAPARGFSSYFDEVSAELEEELKKYAHPNSEQLFPPKREWENPFQTGAHSKNFPGQVAQLLEVESKPTVGVSPEERAELLGKFSAVAKEVKPEKSEPALEIKTAVVEKDLFIKDESPRAPAQSERKIINWGAELVQAVKLEISKDSSFPDVKDISTEGEPTIQNTDDEATDTVSSSESEELESIVEEINVSKPHEICSIEEKPRIFSLQDESLFKEASMENLVKPVTWRLPGNELLDDLPKIPLVCDPETQKQLERVLGDFGIQAKVIRVARGPVITRYELAPAPGVKISRIVNLADDIALGLAARDVRIEAPIPGKAAIGIEVPNKQARSVPFREVLETPEYKEGNSRLRIALGKDIADQAVVADLAKMPHMLVAGATGSGKSVCITALINSLLFNARPDEVKFLMVDPKMVELSIYNGIPHLLAPVVTDPKKAAAALKWVVKEMETRYELFAAAGVRDITRYNRMKLQEMEKEQGEVAPALPWIVVIIDELADLMMVAADDVEEAICRLAQMARAAGIHLVIATQRPSVDVITGVIKANIPSRISFAVSSQIDSRTILDATGAEKLLGRGDMLYSPQGLNKPLRVQGCMVTDDEVQRVISYWKAQGRPEYLDPEGFTAIATPGKVESAGPEDELFAEAGHLIIATGMASVSFLQRKLKLGYARAARLMDLLEENGVVGGYEGSKPRQILLTIEEFEDHFG